MSSCPSYVGASGGDMFDCKSHLDYFFWIVSTDIKPVAANEIAPSPPLNCIIFSSHPKLRQKTVKTFSQIFPQTAA